MDRARSGEGAQMVFVDSFLTRVRLSKHDGCVSLYLSSIDEMTYKSV